MAKLEVSVGINNAGFKAGLDQMREGVARFKGSLASMSGSALGNIFAAGSIVAFTRSLLQAGGAIDDLASRHKVSRQTLQEWKDAVEQNGSSLETLSGSLNKLELAQTKALKGDEGLTQAFAELGVTIDDLLSKSPDQLLLKIGASSMDADAMVKVLGKSSLELRDALQDVAENGLGDVVLMSDRAVKVFASLDDGLMRLGTTAKNFVANGLAEMFVHLQKEGAGLVALYDQIANGASGAMEVMGKLMSGDTTGAGVAFLKMQENAKRIHEDLLQTKANIGAEYSGKDEKGGGDTDSDESKRNEAAAKREDRLQKIRDAEAEAAREALEGQQKINALIEERNRLLEEYKSSEDEDKGLDALEKAQRIQRQLEQEQKRQDDDKKKRADDIAQKKADEAQAEVDREERIAAARKDEFQAREDDIISTLGGEDKLKALWNKKDRMEKEAKALEESDPEAAARKRTEIIGVSAEIRSERNAQKEKREEVIADQADKAKQDQDNAANAKRAAASIPADSLGAVGGGRGNTNGGDAVLRAAERAVNIQQQILSILQNGNGKTERRESSLWK